MNLLNWLTSNYIEVTGAITGIIYVYFEIKQKIWLWPLGIITSALYIWIFFVSKFYADAGLQFYYLFISVYGWYWWVRGPAYAKATAGKAESGEKEEIKTGELTETDPLLGGVPIAIGRGGSIESVEVIGSNPPLKGVGGCEDGSEQLIITRLKLKTGLILTLIFIFLFAVMWYILDNFTDSPVPGWDSFLTAMSIVATWMLARKILEHWVLWIVVDIVSVFIYATKGLYPTVILFIVYSVMAFVGLFAWRKELIEPDPLLCPKK